MLKTWRLRKPFAVAPANDDCATLQALVREKDSTIAALRETLRERDAEIAALKKEGSGVCGGGTGLAVRSTKEASAAMASSVLPPELRRFVPVESCAECAAALAQVEAFERELKETVPHSLEELCAAGEQALAAVALRMRPCAERAAAAISAEITARCRDHATVAVCTAAVDAGMAHFSAVYASVWNLIQDSQLRWLPEFDQAAEALAAACDADAHPRQLRTDALLLFVDAARVKPRFEAFVAQLAARLQSRVHPVTTPPLKHMARILEKSAFQDGDASQVLDVNRAMLVCHDVRGVAAVLRDLNELHVANELVVLRVKNRFARPSPGGWRDVLINLTLTGDSLSHVCELQIAHELMLKARASLPGHLFYNRVRNASELLEKLGMLDSKFGGDGHAWNFAVLDSRPKSAKPMLSSDKRPKHKQQKKPPLQLLAPVKTTRRRSA